MEKIEIECRCKDCIHCKNGNCYVWDDYMPNSVNEHDFCSYGVNKNNQ